MRKAKALSLVATAAFAASAQMAAADTSLFATLADFGGSNLAPAGVANYNIGGVPGTAPYASGFVVNGSGANGVANYGTTPTEQTLGYNTTTSTYSTTGEQLGWEGFGAYHTTSGAPNYGTLIPQTANQAFPVSYVSGSLGNAAPAVNGVGNISNDFNATTYPATPAPPFSATGSDPEIGTSWAGRAGAPGALVVQGYSGADNFGGYDIIETGEMETGSSGANNAFINALSTGKAMAYDFTAPGGGTTLTPDTPGGSGYFVTTFETFDSAGGFNGAGHMQVGPGQSFGVKDTNASYNNANANDDPGAFVVQHGTGPNSYYTAYLPYSYNASATTFLQFAIELNSSGFDAGNVTIDNIRTVSPTWAASGSGLSWNTVGVTQQNANGTYTWTSLASQGNWVGGGSNGLGAPSGSGQSATFGDLESGNATVGLDTNQTLGTLIFNSTGDNATALPLQYNLAGADSGTGAGGSLIMDNAANSAPAAINFIAGSPDEYITAPVVLNSNTVATVTTAGNTLYFGSDSSGLFGGITGSGSLTVSGAGTVLFGFANGYGGGTTVSAGATLIALPDNALPSGKPLVNNGTTNIIGSATLSSLTGTGALSIGNGTEANVVTLATGSGLATQNGLTISATSTLNISNNHMILSYGATDPASTIYGYLKTGYSGGTWTGPGIDSSTAALPANNAHYGVGFVDGKDHVPGASVTSGQIEIAYALYGDVNLDGLVNATDFAIFGANFNKSITGWEHGDFTYTGLVNGTDFALLGSNFGKSASGTAVDLPAVDFEALDAFAAANGLSLPSVPEPATASLLIVAGMGMLGKRRRKI